MATPQTARQILLADMTARTQSRIKASAFTAAADSREEISTIGRRIADRFRGWAAIPDIKGEARASQKVASDYSGDWTSIRDLARMTIIVPSVAECRMAVEELKRTFSAANRRGILQIKDVNPNQDPCGYSSMTVFVRTSNDRPAEIQVNTPEMIYAKQSEGTVKGIIGPQAYMGIKGKYQLEGGLGHALYDVYRVAPGSRAGLASAALSKRYYNYFRSGAANLRERDSIRGALEELRGQGVGHA